MTVVVILLVALPEGVVLTVILVVVAEALLEVTVPLVELVVLGVVALIIEGTMMFEFSPGTTIAD